MGGDRGETIISQGGGSRGYGGLVVLAWTMVALLGSVLLCTFTQRCAVSTLGAGEDISGVFDSGTITLRDSGEDNAVLCGVTPTLDIWHRHPR